MIYRAYERGLGDVFDFDRNLGEAYASASTGADGKTEAYAKNDDKEVISKIN